MRLGTLALLSFALVACASQPKLTREEQLALKTTTYPEHDREAVIEAAGKVLRYADGEDTTFAHRENGFRAERKWLVYAVIAAAAGTFYWDLETEPAAGGGTTATVAISNQAMSIAATPTGAPGGTQTTTTTMPGRALNQPAAYELFWARMDYFLDRREEWPDCGDWELRKERGETWGSLEPLCLVATNRRPADAPDEPPKPRTENPGKL